MFPTLKGGGNFPIDHAGGGGSALRTVNYQFAAQNMAATPSTAYLFPGNGANASLLVTAVGSFAAPFDGNLNTFQVNHRNPSGALDVTYELEIEGVVQAAATIVLSSGATGPLIVVADVPILTNQRFNVKVTTLAGTLISFRPVWQCLLTG